MTKDLTPNRRHLMRIATKAALKIAAIASIPALISSEAQAAGRHSSFLEWCKALVSPPGTNPGTNPICLLKGTLITTIGGQAPIESLNIGDRVLTHSGSFEPIKWIGRMSYRKSPGAEWRFGVRPVRIAKDALWNGAPSRDLYVSQEHAIFDGATLIPAAYLVNGSTLRLSAPEGVNELHYFQLEFAAHHVFYAEGAPVESYLPAGSRHLFDNYDEYLALYGADIGRTKPYAPEVRYATAADNATALARAAAAFLGGADLDPAQIYYMELKSRATEMARNH